MVPDTTRSTRVLHFAILILGCAPIFSAAQLSDNDSDPPNMQRPYKVGITDPVLDFLQEPAFRDGDEHVLVSIEKTQADINSDGIDEILLRSATNTPSYYENEGYADYGLYSKVNETYDRFRVNLPVGRIGVGVPGELVLDDRKLNLDTQALLSYSEYRADHWWSAKTLADRVLVFRNLGVINDPTWMEQHFDELSAPEVIDVERWLADRESDDGVRPQSYDYFAPVGKAFYTFESNKIVNPVAHFLGSLGPEIDADVLRVFEHDISGDDRPEVFVSWKIQGAQAYGSWSLYSLGDDGYRWLDLGHALKFATSSFATVKDFPVAGRAISTPVESLLWYERDWESDGKKMSAYYVQGDQVFMQRLGPIGEQSIIDTYFDNPPVITEIDVAQWKAEHPEYFPPAEPESKSVVAPEN